MEKARQVLAETFGYSDFRLNQAQIIESLIEGRDVLALMPTGGGKSLCYQVPALVLEGTAVVVSPLIALMQDQVDALAQIGVKASFLNSTLSAGEARRISSQLIQGELDLLYVAPERLLTESCLSLLREAKVCLFAIDEAHCVSQWGHDFRPEYRRLDMLSTEFPGVPKIALTATADQRTREEIVEHLSLQNVAQYVNSFDRRNIQYWIQEAQGGREQLWRFIRSNFPDDAGIVYCLSRKKVEATADWLTKQGRKALPYHAGLSAEVRADNQQTFLRQKGVIIVATIAFGMGIDKPDVRFVAHLSLPKSIEAYYQETGRAGRDGEDATVWMSYGLQDVITLRQMMAQSEANEEYKRVTQHKLDAMLGLCELTSCRRQALLRYFGEELKKPCGNCDNCISPPETWDATVAAQKALSCVYRTQQRFGVGYVIDVLIGKADQRILNNQHDQLSTFGIGESMNNAEWRSLFRQLVAQNYLKVDHDRYGALTLTEKSRSLLKGEITLNARKLSATEKVKSKKSTKPKVKPINEPLFDALKSLRRELADIQGVPPYVIFHDATLIELTEKRPSELNEMQFVSGVGSRKLTQYGEDFLEVIKKHPIPDGYVQGLSDTVNQTLIEYTNGRLIEEIAQRRELASSTIYGHLAKAIEAGKLDVLEVTQLTQPDYQIIVQALDTELEPEAGRIKRVYESLDEVFSYGVIRCVAAAHLAEING